METARGGALAGARRNEEALLAGKLVLLADADPDTREIVTLVLEGEGALVTAVDGVLSARRHVFDRPFDLAVVATDLPDGSGLDLIVFMRESGSDCAAVLIASEPSEETDSSLASVGVSDCVPRPLPSVEVLRRRFSRAVEAHALRSKSGRLAAELRAKENLLADLETRADAESRRVVALERTIATSDFDFVYQPIVNASSQRVFAYEALCRPRDPIFPNPGALIGAAERQGCTAALGRVLRQKAVKALSDLPAGAMLFLNLHPSELTDAEFVAIEPFVAQWAGQVVFEITEVGKIGDFEYVNRVIKGLRGSGFRVALDDLGAGYSGLSALARLEPDIVKLDMRLVQSSVSDPRTRRLLRHIVEFANGEGMQVVAEGIETHEQRSVMVDLGCSYLQGFLFGRGQPLDDIVRSREQAKKGAVLASLFPV